MVHDDAPTELGSKAPRKPPAPVDVVPDPERAGEFHLNAMIGLARRIAAGERVRARIPMETLVMSLAQTVVKLADNNA